MKPLISIITACYNHGVYLDEAFDSIDLQSNHQLEHIIIDDGSTDAFTIKKLEELEKKGSKIVRQKNAGLGAARNAGLKEASGKYIIPLDSDNALVPKVILHAAEILDNDPHLTVVHTDALYFGEIDRVWLVEDFDIFKMLQGNFIDACALVRKEVLEEYGGYDAQMPLMGHEDWELWLKIFFNGGKFFHLNQVGFKYRVTRASMSNQFDQKAFDTNQEYLFKKYSSQIAKQYSELYNKYMNIKSSFDYMNKSIQQSPIKSAIKLVLQGKPY